MMLAAWLACLLGWWVLVVHLSARVWIMIVLCQPDSGQHSHTYHNTARAVCCGVLCAGPRPALRVLRLSSHKPSPLQAGSDGDEAGSDADNQDGLLSSADDVASLVTCCPGLQELNLTNTLAGAPLGRLRRLSQLQKLRLGGNGIDD